jgi:hypothetical protein
MSRISPIGETSPIARLPNATQTFIFHWFTVGTTIAFAIDVMLLTSVGGSIRARRQRG